MTNMPCRAQLVAFCPLLFEIVIFDRNFCAQH